MKRKIKSASDIGLEIMWLFEDVKNEKQLSLRIDNYLNNLSGKELVTKEEIKKILSFDIVARYSLGGVRFSRKFLNKYCTKEHLDAVQSLIESIGSIDPVKEKKKKLIFRELSKDLLIYNVVNEYKNDELPLDIILNCQFYSNYVKVFQSDKVQLINKVCDEDVSFKMLNKLIEEYENVSILLLDYLNQKKRNYIVQLVINRVIPLNAIFLYFDKTISITENTEKFYLMLNKKIPRNTIQLAIKRDLPNIKKGKFSVPAN